jgi:hypothetical protein
LTSSHPKSEQGPKLTEPQLEALRLIDHYGLREWQRARPRTWAMLSRLEALHVIRRGPESQHRYGPLTMKGRRVLQAHGRLNA